jgi:hypothetical protein
LDSEIEESTIEVRDKKVTRNKDAPGMYSKYWKRMVSS